MSWNLFRRRSMNDRLPKSRRLRKAGVRPSRRLWLEALEDRTLLNGGGLDPTFGNGGLVTTDIGSTGTTVSGVVIQPTDQKLIVAGSVRLSSVPSHDQLALERYLPNGQLDFNVNLDPKMA